MTDTEHDSDVEKRADQSSACRIDTDETDSEDSDRSHLEGVDDGCGCTEIWEHLSEQRGE